MNWNDWILGMELPIRISAFAGMLCVAACWEYFAPRRVQVLPKLMRRVYGPGASANDSKASA